MDPLPLHDSLNLYVTPDQYTFEPASSQGSSSGKVQRQLTINRLSGEIALAEPDEAVSAKSFNSLTVYGILGLLTLTTTEFLVVVTGRQAVSAPLYGHTVYHATEFRVLPVATRTSTNALIDHPVEKHLVDLVEKHLASSVLWFSYTCDLTRSLQRQSDDKAAGRALWEVADERFFWNRFLQTRLISQARSSDTNYGISQFVLPVIYGSVAIRKTSVGRTPFTFAILSRRSRFRAGTRYFRRGVDETGEVANFNETEQIITFDEEPSLGIKAGTRLSFLQTRGSVPVYWAEINNLRYVPDLLIMDKSDTAAAFRLHISKHIAQYGPTTLVNLVKQKGREKFVKDAYERQVDVFKRNEKNTSEGGKLDYQYFDYAKECGHLNHERVNILVDRMKGTLDKIGYFQDVYGSDTPLRKQDGTVRSNCMDCLDRTNVVQSAFAKITLQTQLRHLGVLGASSDKETLELHSDFMSIFRNMWADHADYVSTAYSGTGALKTDFTRTGIRTYKGMIADGQNSAMRYIKNNYLDGTRQDAFDLFTGAWIPSKGPAASLTLLQDTRPIVVRSMPYVLAFAVGMILAGVILPRSSSYSVIYLNLLWLLLIGASAFFILGNGSEYVHWPRLNSVNEILHYDGPGHRNKVRGAGINIRLPFGLHRKLFRKTRPVGAAGLVSVKPYTSKADEIEMGVRKHVD